MTWRVVSGESGSSGFIVSLAVRTGSAPGDLEKNHNTNIRAGQKIPKDSSRPGPEPSRCGTGRD